MSEVWACTTWSNRKRHYSLDLEKHTRRGPGRYGTTLCGEWAMDDAASAGRHLKAPKLIADLPECKVCAKRKGAAS